MATTVRPEAKQCPEVLRGVDLRCEQREPTPGLPHQGAHVARLFGQVVIWEPTPTQAMAPMVN